MKNKLAISQNAATKVFLTIANSEISAKAKGDLMTAAARMIENSEIMTEDEFTSLPGGAEVYEMIALAVKRSRRARAAAAARRKALNDIPDADSIPEERSELIPEERPKKHPRLKVKCRYKD